MKTTHTMVALVALSFGIAAGSACHDAAESTAHAGPTKTVEVPCDGKSYIEYSDPDMGALDWATGVTVLGKFGGYIVPMAEVTYWEGKIEVDCHGWNNQKMNKIVFLYR